MSGFFYAKMTTMTVDACANPYRFLFDLIRRRPLKSPIGLHRRMNPLLLVSSPTNFRQTSCLVSFMSPVCCCFLVRCSRDVYTETKTNVKSVKKTWQKIEKNYFCNFIILFCTFSSRFNEICTFHYVYHLSGEAGTVFTRFCRLHIPGGPSCDFCTDARYVD